MSLHTSYEQEWNQPRLVIDRHGPRNQWNESVDHTAMSHYVINRDLFFIKPIIFLGIAENLSHSGNCFNRSGLVSPNANPEEEGSFSYPAQTLLWDSTTGNIFSSMTRNWNIFTCFGRSGARQPHRPWRKWRTSKSEHWHAHRWW